MRVMGVDPGLTRCGLSVIEGGHGRKVVALALALCHCWRAPMIARMAAAEAMAAEQRRKYAAKLKAAR